MASKHGSHWLEREDLGDLTVVRLKTGKIPDEDTIRSVFDLISKLISEMGRKQLVLNLAASEFLPSMALGKLVMLNRKVQTVEGRMALCHLSETVHESLQHTRLLPLFKIYPSEAEAVASFAPAAPPEAS